MRRFHEQGTSRFITFSCQKRLSLLSQSSMRDLAADILLETADQRCVEFVSWVIMPNHLHLMVRGADTGPRIRSFLISYKTRSAKAILPLLAVERPELYAKTEDSSGKPRLWLRGGGYDRLIFSAAELEEKIAYIEANPVRRRLCLRPEDYKWSSAFQYGSSE